MLRPVERGDKDLLVRLFDDRYRQEFSLLPLPAQQLSALIEMQREAQTRHYRACYPSASHWIILSDAVPVGHLWLSDSVHELRVLDIALLDSYQRTGIGTRVLMHLQQQALASSRPLNLSVGHRNISAIRLYQRLGFQAINSDELQREMSFSGR